MQKWHGKRYAVKKIKEKFIFFTLALPFFYDYTPKPLIPFFIVGIHITFDQCIIDLDMYLSIIHLATYLFLLNLPLCMNRFILLSINKFINPTLLIELIIYLHLSQRPLLCLYVCLSMCLSVSLQVRLYFLLYTALYTCLSNAISLSLSISSVTNIPISLYLDSSNIQSSLILKIMI